MRTPGETPEMLTCKAGELKRHVDKRLNLGAINEAADATSATQESGADLGEGSAYLTDDVEFAERTLPCNLCGGTAELSGDGSVRAKHCPASGSCEIEWAGRYPENYKRSDGQPINELICRAVEIGCRALVALTDQNGKPAAPVLTFGICELAFRGDNWQKRRADKDHEEEPVDPEDGIEVFDGEGSGREA